MFMTRPRRTNQSDMQQAYQSVAKTAWTNNRLKILAWPCTCVRPHGQRIHLVGAVRKERRSQPPPVEGGGWRDDYGRGALAGGVRPLRRRYTAICPYVSWVWPFRKNITRARVEGPMNGAWIVSWMVVLLNSAITAAP